MYCEAAQLWKGDRSNSNTEVLTIIYSQLFCYLPWKRCAGLVRQSRYFLVKSEERLCNDCSDFLYEGSECQ